MEVTEVVMEAAAMVVMSKKSKSKFNTKKVAQGDTKVAMEDFLAQKDYLTDSAVDHMISGDLKAVMEILDMLVDLIATEVTSEAEEEAAEKVAMETSDHQDMAVISGDTVEISAVNPMEISDMAAETSEVMAAETSVTMEAMDTAVARILAAVILWAVAVMAVMVLVDLAAAMADGR